MADYTSSLPIRTQSDGDAVVKIGDGTTPSQHLTVDSSGALSNNVTKVGGTTIDTNNGTTSAGTQRVTLSSDSTGQVKLATGANVIGAVTQSGTWTVQPGNTANTTPWLVTVSTALPTGANTIGAVTQASGPWTQNITQVGGSALALGQTTMAASIPVVLASNQSAITVTVTDQAPGTIITDYNTASSVAANATSTHTYTVTTGKTLSLGKIFAAASGKMKIEVKVDLGAGLVSKWVKFNSTSNPNMDIDLGDFTINVASTKTVTITRTNLDNQAQDLYSTITGNEV